MFGVMRIMVSKGQGALVDKHTEHVGEKECLLSTSVM